MRAICACSLFLCFGGLLPFYAHVSVGQGSRDLVDPGWGPHQQRTVQSGPTSTTPGIPPRVTPTPLPGGGTATSGLLGVNFVPADVTISSEVGKLLGRELLSAADSGETTSTVLTQAEIAKQIMDRLASVLSAETEDDSEARELLMQRQQAEQIVDPERRRAELERITQNETNFKNRLARRAIDEAGADLFYVPRLKKQYLDDGWCQLFDGHTDFGWEIQDSGHYGGGKFTFGQGEICSDPFDPGMVYTALPYGDVSLQFDYWAEKDSEVLLLMKTPPNPACLNSSCYSFVLNSKKASRPRGLLLGRHKFSFQELRTMREMRDDPSNPAEGTWHSIRVRLEGGDIQVWLDKQNVVTYFDPNPISAGHIAFLVTEGEARFYNVLWQPRQTIVVFDLEGKNALPWHISEDMAFIGNNLEGFRLLSGHVESTDVFGNYVLQMQYRQGINSGRASLFVRGLPGQKNSGYEISLQNFPTRQDRESVRGVDAGAFPQRKDGRYVRAQDLQWTYLTVAAMNRQLTTWVNGVPVCEIEDRRTVPHPPDTGPFLQPGVVRLSVPDDNPSFQFRQLTVSPVTL